MFELIVSEKPQAAAKIAAALADGAPNKIREFGVNYFSLTHKGKEIRVASAVGHLYGLGEKGGESWTYPVFDTEWKPIYKTNKEAKYTKDYVKLLEKLGKDCDEVTIASDFDIEGEVIGLNVMRFALKRKEANRMKFSTLTKKDLVKAYENKQNHIEWGQARAGETRHNLDWFYGINLSRAFTQAIKNATNQFKVLSTGRVQAPALHFLAEKERKIQEFVPEDFSEIYLDGHSKDVDFKAQYELPKEKFLERKKEVEESDSPERTVDKNKIFDKEWSEKVVSETTGKDGIISNVSSRKFNQKVPTPFDLTSLQMEASNLFGISPKRTLEIAQKLYIEGVTSYPRTSSQKLPKELNLKSILEKLEKQPIYREKVALVYKVNPSIKPNEGKKEDAAHPAIHPTGEVPKKLEGQDQKIYDLVVKRFFAVFGEDAIRETNTIEIDINSHIFTLKGTRTLERNWHDLYEPYLKFEDVQLPKLDKDDAVENKKIEELEKKTTPPKRFTDASIIKELEKRNLGTKATRADILNSLRNRGFITGKSIEVTELGLKMDEVLSTETPKLVDEALTRDFEEEMEEIRQEKSSVDSVLGKAEIHLVTILSDISKNEQSIGERLAEASKIARFEASKISKCPSCDKGTLVIKASKKTKKKFVACDNYPDCKTIFNIPQMPVIKAFADEPDENGKIWAMVGKTEGNLRKICLNEESAEDEEKELGHKKYEEEGMTCPECKEGQMVLRKSFYGEFLGCNNYPKCKTMMKIVQGKVDTTPIVAKPKAKKKAPAKKKTTAKKTTTKKTTTKKASTKKKDEK